LKAVALEWLQAKGPGVMNRKQFALLGLVPAAAASVALAACQPVPVPLSTPTPTATEPTTTAPGTSTAAVAPVTARTTTTRPATTTPHTTTPRPSTTAATPTTTTTTPSRAGGCAQPDVYGEGDGGDYGAPLGPSLGPYFIHNNAWNWSGPPQYETLYACGPGNWWVDASGMSGTDVKTYPNVHVDINGGDRGTPLSTWHEITSRFADNTPAGGSWDTAYDVWLNGLATDTSTEVMVWTAYHDQRPAGDVVGAYTADGSVYDIWADHQGYVAYVARTTLYRGTINLMAIFRDGIRRGLIPQNPRLNQICYGAEFVSTAGGVRRFTVSDFSLTMR
jgi:hypothetical protein